MSNITLVKGEPLVFTMTVRGLPFRNVITLTGDDKIACFAQRQGGGERIDLQPTIVDGKASVRVDTSLWSVGTYRTDVFVKVGVGDERATSQVMIHVRDSITLKSDL